MKQTDIIALTDDTGSYRLTRVPSGPVVLEVYYTGLDPQTVSVNVPAGGNVTQDVSLTNSSLFGTQDPTVRLDAFTVAASKETDNASIAINDQRFAPNIKNVVSTDSHGEVMGGNIGSRRSRELAADGSSERTGKSQKQSRGLSESSAQASAALAHAPRPRKKKRR